MLGSVDAAGDSKEEIDDDDGLGSAGSGPGSGVDVEATILIRLPASILSRHVYSLVPLPPAAYPGG